MPLYACSGFCAGSSELMRVCALVCAWLARSELMRVCALVCEWLTRSELMSVCALVCEWLKKSEQKPLIDNMKSKKTNYEKITEYPLVCK